MKKICYLLPLFLVSLLQAQVKVPQPSPTSQIKQTVGLTEVVINYSRPSMRGRTIMGGLVPFDEMWRTGANKNTTFQFSDPVQVEDKTLAAGTYALFTRPGKDTWTLYFYTDTENWGIPQQWDDQKVATTITLPVKYEAEALETFTISVDHLTNDGATITLAWEKVILPIALVVPAKEKAMQSIVKTLDNNPKAGDYYNAASYYFSEKMDMQQAQKWITQAVQMEDDKYWMFRLQAKVFAALNQKEAAIKAAKRSLQLAEKAGNPDYVRMNKADIETWKNN
ncbi:MAG: DUF2911 domain-containing protein [Flavobacteriaceae bacterium]